MTVATPTDKQLAVMTNNDPYLLIALRELFEQAGTKTPTDTEEALLVAESAIAKAFEALSLLENIRTAAEFASLAPRFEATKEDDLRPIYENVIPDNIVPIYEFQNLDTIADLQP